ncbi:MAG: helix-turn-helix transcriptional regulator [bacterium]
MVRTSRRRQGLTQVELSELSGVGPRFVSELERGKPTVHLEKVLAVLSTLGLPLSVEVVPERED